VKLEPQRLALALSPNLTFANFALYTRPGEGQREAKVLHGKHGVFPLCHVRGCVLPNHLILCSNSEYESRKRCAVSLTLVDEDDYAEEQAYCIHDPPCFVRYDKVITDEYIQATKLWSDKFTEFRQGRSKTQTTRKLKVHRGPDGMFDNDGMLSQDWIADHPPTFPDPHPVAKRIQFPPMVVITPNPQARLDPGYPKPPSKPEFLNPYPEPLTLDPPAGYDIFNVSYEDCLREVWKANDRIKAEQN
jgi:hypothetical protein